MAGKTTQTLLIVGGVAAAAGLGYVLYKNLAARQASQMTAEQIAAAKAAKEAAEAQEQTAKYALISKGVETIVGIGQKAWPNIFG